MGGESISSWFWRVRDREPGPELAEPPPLPPSGPPGDPVMTTGMNAARALRAALRKSALGLAGCDGEATPEKKFETCASESGPPHEATSLTAEAPRRRDVR